jgi:iron(III) transport system substrate-binding protein
MKRRFFFLLFCVIFFRSVFAEEIPESQENKEENLIIEQKELNIYSSRKEEFLSEIIKKFSEENNVKINFKNDNVHKLIESLKNQQSDVDLLITADAGSIEEAKEENLLEKTNCEIYDKVDSFFLDEKCYWSAISFRARIIAYTKKNDNIVDELKNYEDLVKTNHGHSMLFHKKILLTSSSSPYNQCFVAYMMFVDPDFANDFVINLRKNAYRDPSGSDTENIKSLSHGHGEVALVNSYYYFRITSSEDEKNKKIAERVGIIFPNQNKKGTHINFSSVGMVRNSKNKEIAEKFISFLLSDEVQKMIVDKNKEYSVTRNDLNDELNSKFGMKDVKFDMTTKLTEVSKLLGSAYDLLKKANWH